jgi:dolichyl-phosphate-mannose--protein O-mannosyl transferase
MLTVVSLVLFLYQLDVPAAYSFDENYHAYTAARYLAGDPDAFVPYALATRYRTAHTWNHPPAGILAIAAGVAALGDTWLGWRLPSAAFGAAGLVLAYVLALRTTGSRLAAGAALVLLLSSGLYFVHSRLATPDIFLTVWVMAALISLYAYLTAPPDRVRAPLLLTGGFVGLAVATKWSGAYPGLLIGLAVLWRWYCLSSSRRGRRGSAALRAALARHRIWVPTGLLALPAAIYLLSYAPLFLLGHGPTELLGLQREIFAFHAGLDRPHPYAAAWWSWPLDLRPTWYHVERDAGIVGNTYAHGNPLVFWAFLPPSSSYAGRCGGGSRRPRSRSSRSASSASGCRGRS